MHAAQRFLMGMIIVVLLAGCGPTASAPIRTVATAVPLDRAATPLARATALPQSAMLTTVRAAATTPSVSPASAGPVPPSGG